MCISKNDTYMTFAEKTNAEEHIQAARRLYNAGVTNYNNLCSQFPSSIIAAVTGHREADYYKSELDKKSDVIFD